MPDAGRVIAGLARGVRLEGAPSGTRPLTDRVKQALFASLDAAGVLDGGFLDLFAGIGAAGIEALSRGATRSVFVEKDPKACALIENNLRRTQLSGGTVVRTDVLRFLEGTRDAADESFAASVADPPYDAPLLRPTLELLGDPARGWLAPRAIVVAKHFWRDTPAQTVGSLALERQRRFGETSLTFYTRPLETP